MDTWYYKGDETIIAAGFDGSDVLAGTFIYDTGPATSYEAVPWAEYDVTELPQSRSGDPVYLNIRLSGESPDTLHYVTLEVTGDLDGDSDVDGRDFTIFADKFAQSGT